MKKPPRDMLLGIFHAGVAAVEGRTVVRSALQAQTPARPLGVVAIGKAAQSMVLGAYDALGDAIGGALVISKSGHLDLGLLDRLHVQALESSHPVPDARSLQAGAALIRFVQEIPRAWPVLFLISGGASSLVEVLAPGIDLDRLRKANAWMLGSGLAIGDMNLVRKSLSLLKGGGLLKWLAGRQVQGLLISDVPGNDRAVIGSGLLVPDAMLADAVSRLDLPDWLRALVRQGLHSRGTSSPPVLPDLRIVATLEDAMQAATRRGAELGQRVFLDASFQSGDAAERGREFARLLEHSPPGLYVRGGETTVCLPQAPGRGGRNQHLALAAAIEITGSKHLYVLSAGTDGTDGPGEDAGALVDGGTVARAAAVGMDAMDCLSRADSGSLLEASGDLIRTGPTGTNVMDLTLGLRLP